MQESSVSYEIDKKPQPVRKSRSHIVLWLILIAAAAGGAFAWRSMHSTQAASAAQVDPQQAGGNGGGRGRGGRGGAGGGAVAVVAAPVRQQDLPIYLDGLGSASAYNTVTVKTRIDGQLNEVDFKEGQDVTKGALLARIDPRPYQVALNQAQAVLMKDESQLADARRNMDRDKMLIQQGVIPQQQMDTQSATVGQLEGAVAADQAQVDNAKLNISYTEIAAPITGRVGLRLVDVGNMVRAADANGLLVITQIQPISVLFSLPEDNLTSVMEKMRNGAALKVLAFSRDNNTQLAAGTLLTIDNQIDQTTGTFKLKAVFDNQDRALWPNEFVNARLLLDVKKNATVISAAALQTGSQGTFVYVVGQNNTVDVRPIKTSITQGDTVAVEQGLQAGERVVTDGQDRLRAGMQVDVQGDARGGEAAAQNGNTQNGDGQNSGRRRGGDDGQAAGAQDRSQGVGSGVTGGQRGQQGRQGFRSSQGGAPTGAQ